MINRALTLRGGEHVVTVRTIASPRYEGAPQWRATCSCDWATTQLFKHRARSFGQHHIDSQTEPKGTKP